ncbi:MAG: MepB family protein, partial [Streptococcus sp.]|nr:MepB family protein [Streptococcus sp.]
IRKNILSTKDSNGKMSMRFYPPWCSNLNTTARATQKWQLQYFREIEI